MYKAFLFLFALLSVSCSNNGRTSIALVSEGGLAVYMRDGDKVRVVSSGSVKTHYIQELSGLSLEEAVEEMFSVDSENIYSISADNYRIRWQMLRHLMTAMDEESPERALWVHGKDLEKTDFLDNIDALSNRFDSALFSSFPIGGSDYEEYRLESIIRSAPSWDDALSFLNKWTETVFED